MQRNSFLDKITLNEIFIVNKSQRESNKEVKLKSIVESTVNEVSDEHADEYFRIVMKRDKLNVMLGNQLLDRSEMKKVLLEVNDYLKILKTISLEKKEDIIEYISFMDDFNESNRLNKSNDSLEENIIRTFNFDIPTTEKYKCIDISALENVVVNVQKKIDEQQDYNQVFSAEQCIEPLIENRISILPESQANEYVSQTNAPQSNIVDKLNIEDNTTPASSISNKYFCYKDDAPEIELIQAVKQPKRPQKPLENLKIKNINSASLLTSEDLTCIILNIYFI